MKQTANDVKTNIKARANNRFKYYPYTSRQPIYCLCGHKADSHAGTAKCVRCTCIKFEVDNLAI